MSKHSEVTGTVIRPPLDIAYYQNIAKNELASIFPLNGKDISITATTAGTEEKLNLLAAKDLLRNIASTPQDVDAPHTGAPSAAGAAKASVRTK